MLCVGMYYVSVQKKSLNDTLAAISHRETMVEGSLFSLHTHALAVEAIGALCTRQFSRQVCYSINVHHLGLEATPILINRTGSHTHSVGLKATPIQNNSEKLEFTTTYVLSAIKASPKKSAQRRPVKLCI